MCCSLKVWPWNRDAPLGWCVSRQPTASRISMPSERRWLGLWLMILERNGIGIFGWVYSASAVEKSPLLQKEICFRLGAVIYGHLFHFPTGNAPEIGGGVRSFLGEETWWIQVHLIRWETFILLHNWGLTASAAVPLAIREQDKKGCRKHLEKCKDMHRHAEHILDQILGSAFQAFFVTDMWRLLLPAWFMPKVIRNFCPKWSPCLTNLGD